MSKMSKMSKMNKLRGDTPNMSKMSKMRNLRRQPLVDTPSYYPLTQGKRVYNWIGAVVSDPPSVAFSDREGRPYRVKRSL